LTENGSCIASERTFYRIFKLDGLLHKRGNAKPSIHLAQDGGERSFLLCLRSDNGNPMKGATMLMTLYNRGVIPSLRRPRVSNDNSFIEFLFKTLKNTAGYSG